MGLQDRLNRPSTNGHTAVADDDLQVAAPPREREPRVPGAVDPYGELKTRIHHAVIATVGVELFKQEMTEDLHDRVLRAVTEQLVLDRTPLTRDERRQIVREITDDILGYGPIEPLLRDDSVSEVMVNAFDRIYCERAGKIERTNATFVDNAHLLRIIDKIVSQVGRRVDEASPMVDARLPDGSRVNAIIPPLALKGPTLTIRKFSRRYRHGQDDDVERDVGIRPRGRAHRHDRGRGRAPAPAGARDHARVPSAQHRGSGRSANPGARPQRTAHAARPDHRRRGSRRRDARHAPGDEHRP
jgi:hypothetical protein